MPDVDWFEANSALLAERRDVEKFASLKIQPPRDPPIRRTYSITADILAFRRCSRQYGFFAVKGYTPAQATQLYFGIVIHEVLDRAHRQYRGLMEGKAKGVPSSDDITSYFRAVTEALRMRGIRPYSRQAEKSALDYLLRFNENYGPDLYPRVKDTEHKLKADMDTFVMHGVVDVLARSRDGTEEIEIWDYKGSHRVEPQSPEMKNYQFQMRAYAGLYKQKNGAYPARAILCFLGEETFEEMVVEVPFDAASVDEAIRLFSETVQEIEHRRDDDDWSPPEKMPARETCSACDIRWDCSCAKAQFPMRYP
ncbi:MAG: PD-(D/E)XK nuclease family protein [Thermoplasmatota archaeon]